MLSLCASVLRSSMLYFFFSSRRLHTRCALVTGVQTCALPILVAGEITQAVRDSSCDVGPIVEGDWLGLARDGIRAVEGELGDAATALLDVLVTIGRASCRERVCQSV